MCTGYALLVPRAGLSSALSARISALFADTPKRTLLVYVFSDKSVFFTSFLQIMCDYIAAKIDIVLIELKVFFSKHLFHFLIFFNERHIGDIVCLLQFSK
jgi:hypothetical protein